MSTLFTYASGDLPILEKVFQLLQGTGLWTPTIDTGPDSMTSWDRFSLKIQEVRIVLNTSTYFSPKVREDSPDSKSSEDRPMCEIHSVGAMDVTSNFEVPKSRGTLLPHKHWGIP